MYRTHTCGELNIKNIGQDVTISGWIQKIRDKGKMIWIDIRDRYGITQITAETEITNKEIIDKIKTLGREYVIQVQGKVVERQSKNPKIPTGDIEIIPTKINILNKSETPPFTIEENTDGGDEIRMKYRYLDLRRSPLQKNIILRHKIVQQVRNFLDNQGFIEIETPYLIKSTPEGARDFIVPSRMNQGEFYALPQSPQTFKQLLMISGYDKYFQIVKCFRDEDLRADRQPEFSQIDCEMSFVEQDDVLKVFENLIKTIFKNIKNIDFNNFEKMPYSVAMEKYGNDKPDLRFDMQINNITNIAKGKNFIVFDSAEYIGGICAKKCAGYSRKQLDKLTKFVQRPQIGAKGLVYVKINEDGTYKSSIDKFFNANDFDKWKQKFNAENGDLLLILAGEKTQTLNALSELRLEMGNILGLRDVNTFKPLWVVDFPLLEWDPENNRYHAKHHPFTSPKKEDIKFLEKNPEKVRANAYDLVINGVEIGGGSIRIHDNNLQKLMFKTLGFTDDEAEKQFGFLMTAFKYGAPPHGGIAFGLDRLVSIIAGLDSIRDVIAFPKNNSGRDVMIDSPSEISLEQLNELNISVKNTK